LLRFEKRTSAAKAARGVETFTARLKAVPFVQMQIVQGLKPHIYLAVAARLKSCPDTKQEFFRNM
jgi:hypothetical protein